MSWSGAHELRAQLVRLWERGELLRDTVTGQSRFPLRLPFKGPSSADVTDRFEAVRAWVGELAGLSLVRVEWQEVRHRVHGAQRQPASVWIDTLDGALGWIGKRADAKLFAQVVASTRARQPAFTQASNAQGGPSTTIGGLHLDHNSRVAALDGVALELTQREWELLELLVHRCGEVVTREDVLAVWRASPPEPGQTAAPLNSNALEVYVHRLRKKLDQSSLNIRNIRGLGYMLNKP